MATVAVYGCISLLYGYRNGRSRVRNRLLTWVELRGFEPLTPSMRTERSSLQNHCLMTLPHVRAFG